MIIVAACAVGLGADRGPVDRLIEQLRAGDARARSEAALRIGLLGPRAASAVGTLDSALDDSDPQVRANAMYSLVRLGSRSPRLLPILAEQIEATPEPPRRGGRKGVTGYFAPPDGWTLSDGGLPYNDPIDALERIRPDAAAFVPLLGKALNSPRNREREAEVARLLPRFPGDCLRTREDHVREAALKALFAVAAWSDPSSRESAGALLAVLADERFDRHSEWQEALVEFGVRQGAVAALAKLDRAAQERAVAQLARELRDLGSPRSYEAALLLPRLGGGADAARSILLDFIRDGDDIPRRMAMVLLATMAEPADAPVVWRAMTAPGAEGGADMRDRMNWWEALQIGPGCIAFCPKIGRTVPSGLIPLGVRTLKAMGASMERRSIREFIAMLREPDGDPDRTRCAIIALGDFGPSAAEAVPVLADIIRAGQEADRRDSRIFSAWDSPGALATAALGQIGAEGNPEALAVLAGLIETPGWTVGLHAARELARLGPKAKPARPALVKALKDPREGVRSSAREALASLGGP
jgi:hypothetical protein